MRRLYKLKADETAAETPAQLATRGNGEVADLHAANPFMSRDGNGFYPWNPGQTMVVPPNWQPIADEYAGA